VRYYWRHYFHCYIIILVSRYFTEDVFSAYPFRVYGEYFRGCDYSCVDRYFCIIIFPRSFGHGQTTSEIITIILFLATIISIRALLETNTNKIYACIMHNIISRQTHCIILNELTIDFRKSADRVHFIRHSWPKSYINNDVRTVHAHPHVVSIVIRLRMSGSNFPQPKPEARLVLTRRTRGIRLRDA
jgi:hypothetical protein